MWASPRAAYVLGALGDTLPRELEEGRLLEGLAAHEEGGAGGDEQQIDGERREPDEDRRGADGVVEGLAEEDPPERRPLRRRAARGGGARRELEEAAHDAVRVEEPQLGELRERVRQREQRRERRAERHRRQTVACAREEGVWLGCECGTSAHMEALPRCEEHARRRRICRICWCGAGSGMACGRGGVQASFVPSVFDVMRSSSFSRASPRLWRTPSNLADTVSGDGRLARILDMMSPPSAGARGGSCPAA